MSQRRGLYTFFDHLCWIWAVVLGDAAGVAVHLWLSGTPG